MKLNVYILVSSGAGKAFSVRLYRNAPGTDPCSDAIFCIILYQQMYSKVRSYYMYM